MKTIFTVHLVFKNQQFTKRRGIVNSLGSFLSVLTLNSNEVLLF
ncbi:hypothetical protein MPR_1475 [Myroides profundi]|nr:hypothetical protein MPR_1475 [Myroides profundi]